METFRLEILPHGNMSLRMFFTHFVNVEPTRAVSHAAPTASMQSCVHNSNSTITMYVPGPKCLHYVLHGCMVSLCASYRLWDGWVGGAG